MSGVCSSDIRSILTAMAFIPGARTLHEFASILAKRFGSDSFPTDTWSSAMPTQEIDSTCLDETE